MGNLGFKHLARSDAVAIAAPAQAANAPCGGDFGTWLQGVKQEAAAQGISQRTIQSALAA